MPGTCKPGATELVGFFQLGWTWCFVFVITLGVTYSLASRSPAQPHLEFLRHLLLTKLPALAWRVTHQKRRFLLSLPSSCPSPGWF